jgi:hypothetical protein
MDRLAELAEYDRSIPGLIDDDFLAAGFTPDEIASYRGTFTPPSLTPQDIAQAEQTYGTLQAPDYTMRETSTQRVQDALINQLGLDPYLAGRYARDIMGDTSPTSQNILDGLGLADLTPLGAVFAVEEGGGTAVEGYQEGDYLKMGLGAAEAGLGVAEAFPLTRPIAEGAGVLAREVYSSPYMADAIGTLRGIRDLDADFLLGRGDPAMAQGVGADVVGDRSFDVTRKDASGIFGQGTERVRYTDPASGGTMEVVVRPDGSASVLELEVPEEFRGQGIGQSLQDKVMQDFPMMGGQVSSKAAATTAYRLGRRPPNNPDATLEDVFAEIDEMSSVNMISPEMQARMEPKQVEVPTDERRGIIAFHGSGADFDRFELSKIGTGEQAQVFGRGLYFTDSEDIAEFYRQSVRGRQDLSRGYEVSYKGNKVSDLGDTPSAEVQPYESAAINKIADNISKVTTMATKDLPQSELVQLAKDKAIKTLEGEIKRTAERTSGSMFDELTDLIGNSLDDELKALQAIDPNDVSFAEGKKYQVRLDVSPEELLNWDMPFDKQTPAAQRAILKTADEITLDDAVNLGVDVFDAPYNGDEAAALDAAKKILLDDFSVNRFLNTWSDIRGSDGAGEELLAKNGLKGITYKADQGPTARDPSAGGPSNYVIFDDKLINIMKKYGIVGPVAVTGIAAQEETSNEI